MSAVLLRCPHCGTERSAPGECDACHEAHARYFCTNHSPGRWLGGPRCDACGATFGDAPRRAAPAPARAPTPATADRIRPASGARGVPAAPPRGRAGVSGRTPGAPPASPYVTLEELLRAASARRPPGPGTGPEDAPRRGSAGGCLLRLLLMVFVFFLMVISSIFLFAGSVVRIF